MIQNSINTYSGQGKRYKVFISVLMGLLGFFGAFYSTRIDFNGFSVNFIWSISLPLLVSLSWGPWYGVLGITLGMTALFPFFLGLNNGWASLVPALSLYLWMIIHGYGARLRRKSRKIIYSIYSLQLIYAGVRWAIYMIFFPILIRFNPPFWNPQAITQIDKDIVLLFVVKGIIMESVLLALCDALLLLPWIRRIFGLPCRKASRFNTRIMAAMVSFGLVFTTLISLIHSYIIDQQDLIRWLTEPDDKTKVTYLLSGILFIIMGGITVRFCERFLEGQEILKASEEKYSTIFDRINDLYMETTMDGRILIASPSAKEILGYEAEELPGMNIMDLYFRKDQRQELMRAITENKEVNNYEVVAVGRSGQMHYLWLHAKIMTDDDGNQKIITVARDVTSYKEATDEIKVLNRELQQRVIERTSELQSAVLELEGFTYTISHDLKSPLRAIDGYCSFIKEDHSASIPGEAMEMIDGIQGISGEMIGLIDKLLAYSILSKVTLHEEPVDLNQMVTSIFRELQVGNAHRQMEMCILNRLPVIHADRVLLRQALGNILSNAVKFSRNREKSMISIDCSVNEEGYLLTFKDNGVGFDMRFSDKLFGILQRMHRAQEFEGTGVGLATVRKIITRHDGRVWIEGGVDQGAMVSVFIPLSRGVENHG